MLVFQLLHGACFLLSLSQGFLPKHQKRSDLANGSQRFHTLNTAFEWLATERALEHEAYAGISWLDPSRDSEISCTNGDSTVEMPLYPIGSTYLPSETVHTLNNVHPRNIEMALDLIRSQDRRFCVVLYAADTGRIAHKGIVMRVVDLNIQDEGDGEIRRILVKCRPEKVVAIESILNPEAFSRESQIRKSKEYLRAKVRLQSPILVVSEGETEDIIADLTEDYNAVRTMYKDGVGKRDLPHYITDFSESLPEWTSRNFKTDIDIWKSCEVWQTLCNTLREGRQMILSADRNEAMVAAAMKKGGPLNLPIHIEDLEPDVRRELVDMEVQCQADFQKLGMDPCLAFQALISLETVLERLRFLSWMVRRERNRLESLALTERNFEKEDDLELPRKGAWFEGEYE